MTPSQSIVAFLLAGGLFTLTPGLDTALVLRTAATGGSRAALFAGAGILLGCAAWGCAVALGLGVVLAASTLAYTVLKVCGALYLAFVGLGLLLRPRRALVSERGAVAADAAPLASLRRGLLTNLLNPKVGVFYVSFLPQFVPQGYAVAPSIAGLVALHVAMTALWYAVLVAGMGRLRPVLQRPSIMAALDRVTGAVFIGFGLRLATDRR